jgi:ABC-type branched-subunit amino acid transport system ATPase component
VSELATHGLSRDFGSLRALASVSVTLRQGEILGLIGPNGSGKTTLLNLVTGIHRPTAGRVTLGDRDITGIAPYRIARLGIARTFQSIRLFAHLSVRDNILVAASAAPQREVRPRAVAARLLAALDLAQSADSPAKSLPHGAQRRLELARALALAPRFLLLDEPAAGLDETETVALIERIAEIRTEHGCGILVIDHGMRFIMRLCDRIHVLDAGRTLFEGSPAEVRQSSEVVEAYLGRSATDA